MSKIFLFVLLFANLGFSLWLWSRLENLPKAPAIAAPLKPESLPTAPKPSPTPSPSPSPSASPTPPAQLRAQSLQLVDEEGRVKAELHLGEDGSGQLRLIGGNGEVRVKLGPRQKGGAGLVLLDERTEPGVEIFTSPEDGTGIHLNEGDKNPLVFEP